MMKFTQMVNNGTYTLNNALHYSARYDNSNTSGGIRLDSNQNCKSNHILLSGLHYFQKGVDAGGMAVDYEGNRTKLGNHLLKAFNLKNTKTYREMVEEKVARETEGQKKQKQDNPDVKLMDAQDFINNGGELWREVLKEINEGETFNHLNNQRIKQVLLPSQKCQEGSPTEYISVTPLVSVHLIIQTYRAIQKQNNIFFTNKKLDLDQSQLPYIPTPTACFSKPMGGSNSQNVGMFAYTANKGIMATMPKSNQTIKKAYAQARSSFSFHPPKQLLEKFKKMRAEMDKKITKNIEDQTKEFDLVDEICSLIFRKYKKHHAMVLDLPEREAKRVQTEDGDILTKAAFLINPTKQDRADIAEELSDVFLLDFLQYKHPSLQHKEDVYMFNLSNEALETLRKKSSDIFLSLIQKNN